MDANLQSLFTGMVGARGRTPTTYKRQFQIEACKVVWPDGTESDVKLSERDAAGTLPVRFHFVKATDGGASPGRRDGLSNVSCDLRIARVVDGSSIAHGSGRETADKLERLAKALAGQLRDGMLAKGESIAVVTLRNRSGTRHGRVIADELADKVTGALIDTGWFDVKERIDLRAILGEKDLESAGIVKQAKVKEKLAGIKYIVIGGVTVTERSKGE